MPVACAIAFSILCSPWGEAQARVFSTTFGESVSITTEAGEVSLEVWSHDAAATDWSGAARLCREGRCIQYRRRDNGPQTLFLLRGADCDVGRRLLVSSTTLAGRNALLAAFSVIPPHGERRDAIPLAALIERASIEPPKALPTGDLACAD